MICGRVNQLAEAFSEPSLFRAWESVAMKRGAPGIDGVSVDDFARNNSNLLRSLHTSIISGKYKPMPMITFTKDKGNQSFRELTISTVRDRIVARCLADFIVRTCDNLLQPQSFAYRPRKGALRAVSQAQRHCAKTSHVVRADIRDFFDTMDHDLLDETLAVFGLEAETRALAMMLIKAQRYDGVRMRKASAGVPQGSPMAPALSNLYLDSLDQALNREGLAFLRYADDILVLSQSSSDAAQALSLVASETARLKLQLSTDKSRIYSVEQGFVFLGFLFNKTAHCPTQDAMDSLAARLEEPAYQDETPEEYASRLNAIRRGWNNYFGANTFSENNGSFENITKPKCSRSNALAPRVAQSFHQEDEISNCTDIPTKMDSQATLPEPENAPEYAEATHQLSGQTQPNQEAQEHDINAKLAEITKFMGQHLWARAALSAKRMLLNEDAPLSESHRDLVTNKLSEIYEQAGLLGAAEQCRHKAGTSNKADQKALEDTATPFGARDVETWLELFGSANGAIYKQFVDGLGRNGFKPAFEKLTRKALHDHWLGRHTLAVPVYDSENKVHFGVIDFDISRQTLERLSSEQIADLRTQLLDDARGMLDIARKAGVEGLLEDSGYKGFHLWFFFHARLSAGLVRQFLAELCAVAGPAPQGCHRELFPGSDRKPDDAAHSQIKLPLGVHQLTRRRTWFLAQDGEPCKYGAGLPGTIRLTASALKSALATWTRYKEASNILEANLPKEASKADNNMAHEDAFATADEPLIESTEEVNKIMDGCSVLRAIAQKAKIDCNLSHIERLILRGILGPLEENGHKAIHKILKPCSNYSPSHTNKFLAQPITQPIACSRVRELLGDMAQIAGCTCRFKPRKNDYFHPLRHLSVPASKTKRPIAKPKIKSNTQPLETIPNPVPTHTEQTPAFELRIGRFHLQLTPSRENKTKKPSLFKRIRMAGKVLFNSDHSLLANITSYSELE